jgi:hypothetical protein
MQMLQKKKLLDLQQKAKERANLVTDDPELHEHLNELEAQINAIVEPQSDEEDPGGNSPKNKPQIP